MIPDAPPEARRAAIEALYAAYASGDPSLTLAAMADDIEFEFVAPRTAFAFAGPRVGKAGALAAMGEIAKIYSVDFITIKSVMMDGDDVCVIMRAGFTERSSGISLETDLIDVAEVKGGKIVKLREFFSVDHVATQLDSSVLLAIPPGRVSGAG